MEAQPIEENNELAQNIQDFIALHGVDADGNILGPVVDGVQGQEGQEYQEVYTEGGDQLTQVEYHQPEQHEIQQYQVEGAVEGQEVYHEQETQYIQEGQEYSQQETQVYVDEHGTAYHHEQETQEYQHIEGQEYLEEGQQYVIGEDGQTYQVQQQDTQMYEGQETIEFHQGEGIVQEGGEHGDQSQETQILDENAIQEFYALHGVDADGNIIANVDGVHVEGDGGQEAVVPVDGDQNNVEMMDQSEQQQEEYVEHVEETEVAEVNQHQQQDENAEFAVTNDANSNLLHIQEAIFNPNTGTLEPMTSVTSTNATTVTTGKAKTGASRSVKRTSVSKVQKKGRVQNNQVKFVVAGESGQQIMLDAKALQGLLQGGGNTITLSGGSGKQGIVLATSSTPQKGRVLTTSSRSPAKILPAPVPVGDQQQLANNNSSPKQPRYMLKQGNVLTPISAALGQSLGGTKIIQVQGGSGNQVQYVRVVSNKPIPSNKIPIAPSRPKPVAPRPQPGGQTIFSLPSGSSDIQGSGMGNFVVLPSNYVVKSEPSSIPVPIRPADFSTSTSSSYNGVLDSSASILGGFGQSLGSQSSGNYESFRSLLEPNGMRPRKPCNCTKSQCLKLYCDCFANGEFCHLCNCNNCFNNLNHEEERQKAIKLVLERNPAAFRPKIGKSSQTGEAHERRHNKGCNCRRSGCLKNYCECYEAKIFCSSICKCNGCKNCIENIPSGLPNDVGVEQHFAGAGTSHRQTLKDLAEAAEVRVQQQTQVRNKMKAQMQDVSPQNNLGNMVPPVVFRYPNGSISYEVITSIVELLLAKSEAGQKQKLVEGDLEKLVLEEYGECLASVMELGTSVGGRLEG